MSSLNTTHASVRCTTGLAEHQEVIAVVLLRRKCGVCGARIRLGTRYVPQPDGLDWQVFSSCRCGVEAEGWAREGHLEALLAEVILAYLGR